MASLSAYHTASSLCTHIAGNSSSGGGCKVLNHSVPQHRATLAWSASANDRWSAYASAQQPWQRHALTDSPCPPLASPACSSSSPPRTGARASFSVRASSDAAAAVIASSNGSAAAREVEEEEAVDGVVVDVSGACVKPVFRSAPQETEADTARRLVRVLFLSEGNVCRSVYAEAIFCRIVDGAGLAGLVECESKAVRDYNLGESPDARAVQMAAQYGLVVDPAKRARMLQPAEDIVAFDLLVVMDKFNAADVLKEVSVFDTINPQARFSSKVRRLGDFCSTRTVEDIDDPLYGNMGGAEELDLLSAAITDIEESCMGLVDQLNRLNSTLTDGQSLRDAVREWVLGMDDMDWLVPPMLQKRKSSVTP